MEKRKEGKPGEARAALRRSVRENGCVSYYLETKLSNLFVIFYLLVESAAMQFWAN